MVPTQTRICPENETHRILLNIEIQTRHTIHTRRLDLVFIYEKKRTYHLIDFSRPQGENKRKRITQKIPGPC